MTPEAIRTCIQQVAQACMEKDAETFASLFLPESEIILSGDRWIGRNAIAQVTAPYLANCEVIAITLRRILIEGGCAVVEWTWQETKRGSGQRNTPENAIVIDFKDGAIARWREYRS